VPPLLPGTPLLPDPLLLLLLLLLAPLLLPLDELLLLALEPTPLLPLPPDDPLLPDELSPPEEPYPEDPLDDAPLLELAPLEPPELPGPGPPRVVPGSPVLAAHAATNAPIPIAKQKRGDVTDPRRTVASSWSDVRCTRRTVRARRRPGRDRIPPKGVKNSRLLQIAFVARTHPCPPPPDGPDFSRPMLSANGGEHSFRIAHVIHLMEVVKGWGVTGDDLLATTGVTHQALTEPRAQLPVPTMTVLLERARALTGEPALGLHLGLHTRATLYGHLGFAVMSAGTIREAIDVSLRFGTILTTALTMRFREDRHTASLIVDEHADFGPSRDIVLLTTLVALWQVSRSLTARELTTSTAEFALPEPSYRASLEGAGLKLRFGRPANKLTFDARSLDLPYTMPDPVALKLAREQCQRELDALGRNADITASVRGLIARPEGGFRGLEEVAAALSRSPRTLKRQLVAEGVSFSELRDRELRERAETLLRLPELSLAAVAARLGYSNVTSFERAFVRWTDRTPAECRRTLRRSPVATA
jgi:AraC-like DNA-binding protein